MPESRLKIDPTAFLANHWQREPLLLRDAIPEFSPPISADHLAGLALEDAIESRLVEFAAEHWHLHHGPFTAADLSRDSLWTLLVQAVDHVIPEVAALREYLDFLPGWRMDDVMVSYAVDGGSVGPHFDNYDVFLLQGEGQRLWKIGQPCDDSTPLLPHEELRILQDFDCQDEFLLNPGDILYLPPGVAHWGIAQGACTTFSIGFRAPRTNDMLSRWVDALLEQPRDVPFYSDPQQSPVERAGEIRGEDRQRAREQLERELSKSSQDHWFGELVTEPRYDLVPESHEVAAAQQQLRSNATRVSLEPGAKLAWQQEERDIAIFANGESVTAPSSMLSVIVMLCATGAVAGPELQQALASAPSMRILDWLVERGCVNVDE